ncbi:MAG: aldo/keto reductase [Nevskiales bacterium]
MVNKMLKYINLGHSQLRVSELCLGTMTFGEEMGIGTGEKEAGAIFEGFLRAGGNFVDTADIYNRGTSERMLGCFIRSERDYLVVASKYSLSTRADDPNAGGNHRKNLVQSLEASLRRLETPYLDLYWVHGWDPETSLTDLMRALDDQVRAGKVLHLGISNVPAWVASAANVLARERGWTPFTAMQLHYNLIERSIERDFFELALAQNMAITPWSPLAGGLLTGKFDRDAPEAARIGARLASSPFSARTRQERNIQVAEALSVMARGVGCRPAQLALAWLLQRSTAVVVPIIGARSRLQLDENLGGAQISLTAEQLQQLDAVSAPVPEYPQSLLGSDSFQRMLHGDVRHRRKSSGNRP